MYASPFSFLNHIFYLCDKHFRLYPHPYPPKLTELADKPKSFVYHSSC